MESNIYVNLPEEIILSLRDSKENIVGDMKETVAVKYYKEKKLSLGQCSKLAEMTKEQFIELLSTYNISIYSFENVEELSEDIKNA